MAKVTLDKLTKIYLGKKESGATAVDGICLEIEDGEFMVLVGPSGCGKSTTLRMIAGLEEISGGTLSIDGRIVNDVLPKDRDIAMVFQNYALYPHMSVKENMAFGLKLRKLPAADIDQRVGAAAGLLGLGPMLDRLPKSLSGGQRQRVAVGRAIVRQPKVFLFDEPLSNLDANMRVSTRTEISKLHTRLSATMIYVIHDQVEAMTMGDRICVMKDGRIMQVPEPLTLYNRPENMFVAGFIGSPSMNFFPGTIRSHGTGLDFLETNSGASPLIVSLDERLARQVSSRVGRAVILGLRPEDISDAVWSPSGPGCEVKVELVEPMGAETYLHLTTGATNFIARVKPLNRYTQGQFVSVFLDLTKAHCFDPATQNVIK